MGRGHAARARRARGALLPVRRPVADPQSVFRSTRVMLRFASLGSGSRGNATLIQTGDALVLVDCGFAARELERRCRQIGIEAGDIDALVVTHEHGDHLRGVGAVARRFRIPVWMTHGTWHAAGGMQLPELRLLDGSGEGFAVNGLCVEAFPVPHDAAEPVQLVLRAGGRSLGLLTDTGSLTPHILASLDGVDALLLEANHDPEMLAAGPYPPVLQARVGGAFGHLSNAQAAAVLAAIDHVRLGHLVVGHISAKNNRPELVRDALAAVAPALNHRARLLAQDCASDWFVL
jgi:phosphoribosyl 1,2-cyclic phosphodiesterase